MANDYSDLEVVNPGGGGGTAVADDLEVVSHPESPSKALKFPGYDRFLKDLPIYQQQAENLRTGDAGMQPGTELSTELARAGQRGIKTAGTVLDTAGKALKDVVGAYAFEAIGDPESQAKQLGITNEQLGKLGFKDLEPETGVKPLEQGMQTLPTPLRLPSEAAYGLVETAPRLAAVTAAQALGVPTPVAAGAIFGTTSQGFDPKQAAIAAALPFVGKYSGELSGVIAKRFGVSNEAALNAIKGAGATVGPSAPLIVEGEREIANLPEDQKKSARIELYSNILGQSALGLMGVEAEKSDPQRLHKEFLNKVREKVQEQLKKGEEDAISQQSTEPGAQREVRPRVGEETPLQQPDEGVAAAQAPQAAAPDVSQKIIPGETIVAATSFHKPSGQTFSGMMHPLSMESAFSKGAVEGVRSFEDYNKLTEAEKAKIDDQFEQGFLTNKGRRVSREEAAEIGQRSGQMRRAGTQEKGGADSDDLNLAAGEQKTKTQSTTEQMLKVQAMTGDQFLDFVKGQDATKLSHDLAKSVPSSAIRYLESAKAKIDAQRLDVMRDLEKGKPTEQQLKDFNSIGAKSQYFGEAIKMRKAMDEASKLKDPTLQQLSDIENKFGVGQPKPKDGLDLAEAIGVKGGEINAKKETQGKEVLNEPTDNLEKKRIAEIESKIRATGDKRMIAALDNQESWREQKGVASDKAYLDMLERWETRNEPLPEVTPEKEPAGKTTLDPKKIIAGVRGRPSTGKVPVLKGKPSGEIRDRVFDALQHIEKLAVVRRIQAAPPEKKSEIARKMMQDSGMGEPNLDQPDGTPTPPSGWTGTPKGIEVSIKGKRTLVPWSQVIDQAHEINVEASLRKRAQAEAIPAGPGAQTAAQQAAEAKPELAQLTDALKTLAEGQKRPAVKSAYNLGERYSQAKDKASKAVDGLKAAAAYGKEKLSGLPVWNTFKEALGKRQLALTESVQNGRDFIDKSLRAVPKAIDREAISNWVDAGGDDAKLQNLMVNTKPQYKRGYMVARRLTPEQRVIAENIRNYFESRLQDAIDAGILQDGVEDYIHRIYPKDSDWKKGAIAEIRSGVFAGKPALAKQRVFQYDAEAEAAGYEPVKDFSKRVAAYDLSLNKAIADRQMVKEMMGWEMKDGRPAIDVAGRGVEVGGGADAALLVKPKAKFSNEKDPENNRAEYVAFDHPALRKFKWIDTDNFDKPTLVQGDVLVHPDALKEIKAVFGKSRVREYVLGRAALGSSAAVKQTMLDLSGFHQVQITVHGWEHKTFKPVEKIDMENPVHRNLISHGLVAGETGGHEMFDEGLAGSSLTKHIPWIGPKAQEYKAWLFNDYIPRLKMAMGEHALERNRERYAKDLASGKMSEDQLYHLTANQSNAAFGELNYEMMGRNKTVQDLLRIGLLAPDFFEARAKFVGQSLTKYGGEQRSALLLGAATMYITARIINKLLDGQYHFEPRNAFSVVYKNKAYSLRTVQGDLLKLFTEPEKFIYSRLNPLFGRTILEGITQRDAFGRKRTHLEQLEDLAKTIVPITARGFLDKREQTPLEAFLNAFGVTNRRDTANDEVYRLADKWKQAHGVGQPGEFIYDPDKDPYRRIKLALVFDKPEAAAQEISEAIKNKTIDPEKMVKYFTRYGRTAFTGSKKNDAAFFKSLTPDEKKTFQAAQQERAKIAKNLSKAFQYYRENFSKVQPQPSPEATQ